MARTERWKPPTVKPSWTTIITAAVFAPFALLVEVPVGVDNFIRWRIRERQARKGEPTHEGDDAPASTSEILNGETRDVVSITAGGFAGALIANLVPDNTGIDTGSPNYFISYLVLIMVIAGVIIFHRSARSALQRAKTGAWEPGVRPEVALRSLQKEYENQQLNAWPGTATRALQGRREFWGAVRSDLRLVLWRAIPWTIVAVLGLILTVHSLAAAVLFGILVIATLGATVLSIVNDISTTTTWLRRINARADNLESRQQQSHPALLTSPRDQLAALRAKQDEISQQLEKLLQRTPPDLTDQDSS